MKIKDLIELLSRYSPDIAQNHDMYISGFGCWSIMDYYDQELDPEIADLEIDNYTIDFGAIDNQAPDLWLIIYPLEYGAEYEKAQDFRSACGAFHSGEIFITFYEIRRKYADNE